MAKLTREQLNKMNEKMSNDFGLDIQYFCTWGEKTAVKYIKVSEDPENDYLVSAKLHFVDTSKMWEPERNYNIELLMEYWKSPKGDRFMTSSSRKRHVISQGHDKQLFSLIQKETANWPNEKILEIYETASPYKFLGEL